MQGGWQVDNGEWKRYSDDCETESQCSALAVPNHGWGSSAAAAASSEEHTSGPSRSRVPCPSCFGDAGCPYCFLRIGPEKHHDLKELGMVMVDMKLKSEFSDRKHPEQMQGIMGALFLTAAAACVRHTELVHPGDREEQEERKKSLVRMQLLSPAACSSAGAVSMWGGMIPPPPPADSMWGSLAQSSGKKKKAKKWDWNDPTGEWRNEPKVLPDVERVRGVKVKVDGPTQWEFVKEPLLQVLLQFYDRAEKFQELKSVEMLKDRAYDIRFEGGAHMTQRSTKHDTIRDMEVLYVPIPMVP